MPNGRSSRRQKQNKDMTKSFLIRVDLDDKSLGKTMPVSITAWRTSFVAVAYPVMGNYGETIPITISKTPQFITQTTDVSPESEGSESVKWKPDRNRSATV